MYGGRRYTCGGFVFGFVMGYVNAVFVYYIFIAVDKWASVSDC